MYLTTLVLSAALVINSALSASLNAEVHTSSDFIHRVARGKNATVEEFPHLVFIIGMHGFFGVTFCGGSIISPRVILTAAHCLDLETDMTSYIVRVGKSEIPHHVRKVVVHPEYAKNVLPPSHDVAVLVLESPIEIDNKTTKVISMFESGEESQAGTRAVLAGWGQTSASSDISEELQSLDMRIVGKDECKKSWKGNLIHKFIGFVYKLLTGTKGLTLEDQICASSLSGDKHASVCQGDSGGPLVVDGKVAGIASFATKNCQSEPPNVFTEVAHYRQWINERLAESENDDY